MRVQAANEAALGAPSGTPSLDPFTQKIGCGMVFKPHCSSPRPPANFPKCGFKRKTCQNFRSKRFGQNLLAPKPLTISINPKP